jgi:hypothetical protein
VPHILLEVLKKSMKKLSERSRYSDRDSNQTPYEYKDLLLLLDQTVLLHKLWECILLRIQYASHWRGNQPLLLQMIKKTPWSESASELYRPSDRRLSAKWLPTCADRRCHMVSVTDPSGRISRFSDDKAHIIIKALKQLFQLHNPLYSRYDSFGRGSARRK